MRLTPHIYLTHILIAPLTCTAKREGARENQFIAKSNDLVDEASHQTQQRTERNRKKERLKIFKSVRSYPKKRS